MNWNAQGSETYWGNGKLSSFNERYAGSVNNHNAHAARIDHSRALEAMSVVREALSYAGHSSRFTTRVVKNIMNDHIDIHGRNCEPECRNAWEKRQTCPICDGPYHWGNTTCPELS